MNRLDCFASPWRVTFETNPDRCNLHCIMCDTHSSKCNRARHGKDERMLPIEPILKTIRDLSKLGLKEVIPSTMGEPLLYPEFDKILEVIKECGVKLNLTTNGTFPIKGVEDWSKLILPIASDVKISMNGSNEKIAESIPTFMRSNLDDLPSMLKMAIEMGFDRFKGHHVWITNDAMKLETLRIPEYIDKWNDTVDELYSIAVNRIKLVNVSKINESTLNQSSGVCPFLGREAWIEHDGSFQVCCCPSEERAKFGDFGNINESAFIDLWDSDRYRNFVDGWGEYEPCSHCNMRVENR